MKNKKNWIVGSICLLIPILISISLFVFIIKQVDKMATDQRTTKIDNYSELNTMTKQQGTVFFGDSITELCPFEELYSDITSYPIINRGISGETTNDMLDRFEDTIVSLKPRNLIMLMGVNDISSNLSAKETIENIKKMIKITKEKSATTNIVVQAIYPINKSDVDSFYQEFQLNGRSNEAIKELNKGLEIMVKEENVTFLNVNKRLENTKGELKKDYSKDGLHPNIKGYLAIKEDIVKVLQ